MSTKQIEMLQEQVDAIVINELQETLEMNIDWGAGGQYTPDFELIHAVKTCLAYFMNRDDYAQYCAQLIEKQEKPQRKKK
jgi:hypothetical protein